ncbi:MAG TPA: glycosyltransferase family 2 protein [Casimicrobiaceae bacterium]|nr:glycosyltransferase family 2 protein [Casimicrobiaceae bacterium]
MPDASAQRACTTAAAAPPRFSLVVATIERVLEVDGLLASLAAQTCTDFEVIVVDQNGDERLRPVLARYAARLAIRHLRATRGLSRSRNAGLAVARGATVAFPDDDCRYAPDTLARVAAFLDAQSRADGITGRVVATAGERAPARFGRRAHWLDRRTAYLGGMSCVIFLRAALCARVGAFDPALGLGATSPWTAAEETDYLARAVEGGARIRFEPSLVVDHPGWRGAMTATQVAKGGAYARAFGYVMRRHGATPAHVAILIVRALVGAFVALARGRTGLARYHAAVARGRWRGYREGRRMPLATLPAFAGGAAGPGTDVAAVEAGGAR